MEQLLYRGRVCTLTSVHPVFDTRIFHKEVKTSVKAGYSVVLIAQYSKDEVVDGVKIIALPKPKSRFHRIAGSTFLALRLALKQKADIYHFHDPELVVVGVLLKLLTRKKVVYDVHEDYAKQILSKDWLGNYGLRKIASILFKTLEQFSAHFFDHVVTATPDIAKNFSRRTTITLRNLPILGSIDKASPAAVKKVKPAIIYAGDLSMVRGTKEIIQAMEFIKDKAELWLLGRWLEDEFMKECSKLEGWKYTKYLGFLPLGEVYTYMKRADAGIAVLHPEKNYITSLPVKAFEYMACSLPMVMSRFPYWQKMFSDCALFVDPHSPRDIAEKISYLLDNPDKARKLGKKGKDLINEEYSWESESNKLLRLYKELLAGS